MTSVRPSLGFNWQVCGGFVCLLEVSEEWRVGVGVWKDCVFC